MSGTQKARKSQQLPSSARSRRLIHLDLAARLRERKRLRKQRREIHSAMTLASIAVLESEKPRTLVHLGPYRAPDKKDGGKGWHILDADDRLTCYSPSRDKARAQAKLMTDAGEVITEILAPSDSITQDEAMLQLGWERTGVARGPVEEKYRRVAT